MVKKVALPLVAMLVVAAGAYYFVQQRSRGRTPPDYGIPIYPGAHGQTDTFATRLSQRDRERLIKAVILNTDDPPGKVIEFYKEQLKGKSRVLETKSHGLPTALFQLEVNGEQRIISVRSNGDTTGQTEIFIGKTEPKTEQIH